MNTKKLKFALKTLYFQKFHTYFKLLKYSSNKKKQIKSNLSYKRYAYIWGGVFLVWFPCNDFTESFISQPVKAKKKTSVLSRAL